MPKTSPDTAGSTARRLPTLRRGYVLAFVVLIGSLLMVWLYASKAGERELAARQTRFVAESGEIAMLLQQRLLHYELALRGGVSLYWSVSRPTPRQWRDYVGGLDIEGQFQGLLGLGYAPYLRRSELEVLQLAMRDEGQGLLQIQPQGAREIYGPVLMFEPQAMARPNVIGFDMFSQSDRHRAMAAARDSGEIRLSTPVPLIQQGIDGKSKGLLMYAPIYANGIQPANMVARRTAMSGWVYAPFHIQAFIDSALQPFRAGQAIRITDLGDDRAPASLLYRDANFSDAPATDVLHHAETFDLYGRRWRIDFQSTLPGARGGMSDLHSTIAVGTVMSLLLFAVILVLAHTQSRAERLAEAMSESYRRSEQRFRNAMLYSGSGIALLDGGGRIVEANPTLARILGVAPGALPGSMFADSFVDPSIRHVLADGPGNGTPVTLQVRRGDGSLRHVQLVRSPVPGDVGSDVAELVQLDDVTDRLHAEREVRMLNRTLEARVERRTHELTLANHELESFAYSVSHDLRAPLRTVEGFGRLLAERYSGAIGPDGVDYLSRVRNAANRMDALIDALLKMSRIAREPLQFSEVDLGGLAAEVVSELRQSDPDRDVEVVIEPGLCVGGDASLLRNLLQNLLGNAWKFTAGRKDARIEFARSDAADDDAPGLAAFHVRDNGAGFDPAYASKLFRPFQRLHAADEFEGHGIGLATVKRIVERHGGTIRASAGVGEGATFRFTLPASADPEHAPAGYGQAEGTGGTQEEH